MPAKIYFGISLVILGFAFFQGVSTKWILLEMGFIMLWTWVISLLCNNTYSNTSWLIVLFSYTVIIILAVRIVNIIGEKEIFKAIELNYEIQKEGYSKIQQSQSKIIKKVVMILLFITIFLVAAIFIGYYTSYYSRLQIKAARENNK